ncbi:MAG: spore germination protein [Erysipelotrichaceae bacterium]|nr:spore germination protein [Erysipelotrichaceae bacterium]
MKDTTLSQLVDQLQNTISDSFDLVYRRVTIKERHCVLAFLSSLSDNALIADIVESIVITANHSLALTLYPGSVEAQKDPHKAITALLSGQCLVMVDGYDAYYCVETRHYPSRATGEPSVEKSVRGAHDGFVENIILNVGLIRRRIRDPKLRIVINREGVKTRTDIAYVYIEHLVDPDILTDFEHRLTTLDEREILSERNLCEQLYGKTWNPYPHVRYSERPDICAIHLLQGYLVVLVDNSPSAMIIPTTFFEQSKQIEEYTQTTLVGTFTRIIRLTAILFSLYLMPLWIALVVDQNPTALQLPLQEVRILEFGFQVIFADIVVEWIRQSLIHTPSVLSSIMSFIAVFVLGEMAVNFGVYTNEILIMVALCNIGNLLTPSYELSLANKVFRILIGLLALCFGQGGFCAGVLLHVIVLMSTKSIKFPYLYPLIPFSYKECKKILLGAPIQLRKE